MDGSQHLTSKPWKTHGKTEGGWVLVWKKSDGPDQEDPRDVGGRCAWEGWRRVPFPSPTLISVDYWRLTLSWQITSPAQHLSEVVISDIGAELEPLCGDNKHGEAGHPLNISSSHPPIPKQRGTVFGKEQFPRFSEGAGPWGVWGWGIGRKGEKHTGSGCFLIAESARVCPGPPPTSQPKPLPLPQVHITSTEIPKARHIVGEK